MVNLAFDYFFLLQDPLKTEYLEDPEIQQDPNQTAVTCANDVPAGVNQPHEPCISFYENTVKYSTCSGDDEKQFKCKFCSCSCTSYKYLLKHLLQYHTQENKLSHSTGCKKIN